MTVAQTNEPDVTVSGPSADDAAFSAALSQLGALELRPGQAEAIAAALRGRDSLVVMATGSGKSLCYQLPALLLPGICVVVSPLIALMRDQVETLRARGIEAVCVNSSQSDEDRRAALSSIRSGRCRIVYAAPERLRLAGLSALLRERGVSLVAIDEAHCAAEWGHDFRPDYRDLGLIAEDLGARATMALTATATVAVQQEIVRTLRLSDPCRVIAGVDRPNITFDVLAVGQGRGVEAKRLDAVTRLVREHAGRRVLVYCRTRKATEKVAEHLSGLGTPARAYHAGRSDRTEVQDAFAQGTVMVVCATNAFGMGVDMPNIGLVVHYHLPDSVEAYYQEAGRAGRDGGQSRAVLLATSADQGMLWHRVYRAEISPESIEGRLASPSLAEGADGSCDISRFVLDETAQVEVTMALRIGALCLVEGPSSRRTARIVRRRLGSEERRLLGREVREEIGRRRRALEAVIAFSEGPTCRRRSILRHFGDERVPAPVGRCCDICDPIAHRRARAETGTAAPKGRRAAGTQRLVDATSARRRRTGI